MREKRRRIDRGGEEGGHERTRCDNAEEEDYHEEREDEDEDEDEEEVGRRRCSD